MYKQIIYAFFVFGSFCHLNCGDIQKRDNNQNKSQVEQKSAGIETHGHAQTDDIETPNVANNKIPAKVYRVLEYVRAHGEAMPGYVGGRVFQNRERKLATKDASGKKINYQEWDVNPKRGGVNRGVERLVTGSDNRAWYSNDHYQTFVEVK